MGKISGNRENKAEIGRKCGQKWGKLGGKKEIWGK